MKKINKIYVIACQHGNELFGLRILARLAQHKNSGLYLKIGNLEAVSKRVRHIETDLNRSYGVTAEETAETILAGHITQEINEFDPDLILDLHTSIVDVGKVAILPNDTQFLRSVSHKLLMDRIAVMIEDVARKSLIGTFPDKAIALEFGKFSRSDKVAEQVSAAITSLLGQQMSDQADKNLEVYKVHRVVAKQEIADLQITNFDFNETLGGYPVLMGESNYDEIAGFLAQKVS